MNKWTSLFLKLQIIIIFGGFLTYNHKFIFFSYSKFPLIWFRSQLGLLPPYSKLFIITNFYLSKNVAISCLFRYGILNIIIRIHGTVNKLDVYNTSKRRLLLNPFRPSTFKPFFSAA